MTSYGPDRHTYCAEVPAHSGQMFDWWRCSPEGGILHPLAPMTAPPTRRSFPLRRDQLCWPLCKGPTPKNSLAATLDPLDDCEVSRDYWPDKKQKGQLRPEHQRPPWTPTLAPNKFGVVSYPPPYTYYCRTKDRPLTFVHKI